MASFANCSNAFCWASSFCAAVRICVSRASFCAASLASTMANASRCQACSSAVAFALAASYAWIERSASLSASTSACSACSPRLSSSICACSWIASSRSDSAISANAALRSFTAVTPRLKTAIRFPSAVARSVVTTPSLPACSAALFNAVRLSLVAWTALAAEADSRSYSLVNFDTADCACPYSVLAAFCASRRSMISFLASACLSVSSLNLVLYSSVFLPAASNSDRSLMISAV